MDNGVEREAHGAGAHARPLPQDALGAVLAAECALADHVATTFGKDGGARPTGVNAFGDPVSLEHGEDAAALAAKLAHLAGEGQRCTLIARPAAFAAARKECEAIARRRLPLVFHALTDRGEADAYALASLGWAVLFASGVQDAIDLALVARRAAEDSGTPFFVVHERAILRRLEPVAAPPAALCDAFLGARATRVHRLSDAAHPSHAKMSERAFSERVPFALGSALRGLEGLTGRRHDVIERSSGEGAALVLVGAGALGEALLGEAERLRASGHDVSAVQITALRPFPGPRLIRALARAHVVTVLETADEPLAQSNPLTREVKAAFADALTWAPDYPGIGRLPGIHSGVVSAADHPLEAGDLDAVVRNMLDGDQGKRLFVMGSDSGLTLPRDVVPAPYAEGRVAMRGRVGDPSAARSCAELCATVVTSALALRCRVSVAEPGESPGHEAVFDLVASREPPRGVASPHAVDVVAIDDPRALIDGNPLARAFPGGLLAVATSQTDPSALWADLPVYVKAIVFDRGLRVIGFPVPTGDGEERRWLVAAAFAGVAVLAFARAGARATDAARGARPAIDGSLVEREAEAGLRALGAPAAALEKGAKLARRIFEAPLEVPRATIEHDLPAVRLGRRDARAGVPEG